VTEPTSYPEPAAPPPPEASSPSAARPGIVTGAGIVLIVLGSFTLLLALILLLVVGLFAGAAGSLPAEADMPGIGPLVGAFAGLIFVLVAIVGGFGALQLVSGIKVLGGRNWARITGIVVAAISGLFALAGLGDQGGQFFSLAMLLANGFVIWALATTGGWFTRTTPA
jgi:hypothetical protein